MSFDKLAEKRHGISKVFVDNGGAAPLFGQCFAAGGRRQGAGAAVAGRLPPEPVRALLRPAGAGGRRLAGHRLTRPSTRYLVLLGVARPTTTNTLQPTHGPAPKTPSCTLNLRVHTTRMFPGVHREAKISFPIPRWSVVDNTPRWRPCMYPLPVAPPPRRESVSCLCALEYSGLVFLVFHASLLRPDASRRPTPDATYWHKKGATPPLSKSTLLITCHFAITFAASLLKDSNALHQGQSCRRWSLAKLTQR